jgi:restriction system protein
MAVPTYDYFIEPLIRYLVTRADGASVADAQEAVAIALGLTGIDRAATVPSGQPVYKNRCGWAHDRLKRAGYSVSPKRGWWKATQPGRDFVSGHPQPFAPALVAQLATGYLNVILSPPTPLATAAAPVQTIAQSVGATSPDERLASALAEIRESVAVGLLELLVRVSPTYFEVVVLDVLHRMGYGTSREDLEHVGGSGDGGIDGIISLDRLGFEKVYVQAKRWQSPVGRPEVQGFFGALAGHQAKKGVMITTSSFTNQAIDYAKTVSGLVLVDGVRLAELMIEYDIGVTSKPIRVPKLDSDYFDE